MKKATAASILVVTMLLAVAGIAQTQQPGKIPRIGYVSTSGSPNSPGPSILAFRRGLKDLGYIEDKNIHIEYRYIEGMIDRSSTLVAELVESKVDLLVVTGFMPVRAAKEATKTIPIVMMTTQDPVATGLVDSLARPGGNLTGNTSLTRELSGKRLELFKEVVPKLSRVAALWNADEAGAAIGLKEYEAVAGALKIQLQPLGMRPPNPDLEGAFQDAVRARSGGLITVTGSLLSNNAKSIADLAIKHRMPSMFETYRYVDAGGLMYYSANDDERYVRAAYYVDRILKGAKPADLPVEQPMKFELVINLKTAKQIGLTIPPEVLARAIG